jgi:hypothetical protein
MSKRGCQEKIKKKFWKVEDTWHETSLAIFLARFLVLLSQRKGTKGKGKRSRIRYGAFCFLLDSRVFCKKPNEKALF